MEKYNLDEVIKKNRLLLYILWIIIGVDLLINVSLNYYLMLKLVTIFALFPLIILTFMMNKLAPRVMQYILSFSIVISLFLINLFTIDYINLLFLLFIPLFSLFYREWKLILITCLSSGLFFCYFIFQHGHEYFVNWGAIDGVYWIFLLSTFYVIILIETKISETNRKRLQVELEEIKNLQKSITYKELRYRSMLKQSSEGIFAFDPITKRIVEANQQFCKITGYDEKEILTKTLYDIVANYSVEIDKNIQKSMNKQTRIVGERKYLCKNGKLIDVEVLATCIETENEKVVLVNVRDITEKLKNDFELRLAKNILDYTLDGAVVTNLEGKIIYANPSFEKITGFPMAEVLGNTLCMISSAKHNQEFYNQLWRSISSQGVWEGEMINKKKNGSIYTQRTQIHTILDEENRPLFYTAVFRDITLQKATEQKLIEANEELNRLSKYDGLLAIPNRRFYDETLNIRWQQALEYSKPLSLILLDIDHFKIYNDTYGHLQGDDCLKQVARTLQNCLSNNDYFLARFGGEEFSVILPNTNIEESVVIAEKLRQEIENLTIENKYSEVKPTLTISLGVATIVPTTETTIKDLINEADHALYEAKALGRNHVGTVISKLSL